MLNTGNWSDTSAMQKWSALSTLAKLSAFEVRLSKSAGDPFFAFGRTISISWLMERVRLTWKVTVQRRVVRPPLECCWNRRIAGLREGPSFGPSSLHHPEWRTEPPFQLHVSEMEPSKNLGEWERVLNTLSAWKINKVRPFISHACLPVDTSRFGSCDLCLHARWVILKELAVWVCTFNLRGVLKLPKTSTSW